MREILNSKDLTYEGLALVLLNKIMETNAGKRVKTLKDHFNLGDDVYVIGSLRKGEKLCAIHASYDDLIANYMNGVKLSEVCCEAKSPCEFTQSILEDESTLGIVPVLAGLEECLLHKIHRGITSYDAEPITSCEGLIYHPALYLRHDLFGGSWRN